MVFIGNPRRETNRVGGDRIILRSIHSKLHLQHTCSILSIKIEVVEVGVVRVFIPNIFLLRGVHPPILRVVHATRSRYKKSLQWAMEATALAVHGYWR